MQEGNKLFQVTSLIIGYDAFRIDKYLINLYYKIYINLNVLYWWLNRLPQKIRFRKTL